MENQLNTETTPEIQSNTTPTNKLTVISLALSALSIIALTIAFVYINQLSSQIEALKVQNAEITETNDRIANEQNGLKLNYDGMKTAIENVDKRVDFTDLENYYSGAIVTNDLVLDKLLFIANKNDLGEINYVLELATQPGFAYNYLGQGRFDLSDRELKAAVLPVIEQFKESVKGNYPDFEKTLGTMYVTIQNYDIGTYENGEFLLKGE